MEELVLPDVSGNGMHTDQLYKKYSTLYESLWNVYELLKEVSPNGRDYILSGQFKEAAKQHTLRLEKFKSVMDDIEAITGKFGFADVY